jgi:hypothetical protein
MSRLIYPAGDGSRSRIARLKSLVVLLAGLTACSIKGEEFFEPTIKQQQQPPVIEETLPKFIAELPASTLGVGPFAINSTSITLVPSGGATASQVTATANGQTVPVTVSGNTVTASLAGKPDGLYTLTYSLPYNSSFVTAQYAYQIKNTGPVITIPATPLGSSQSQAASTSLALAGTISDPFFYGAVGAVLKPGPSNTCGNTDNTLWPQGTGAGQVSGNSWNYTNSVMSNGGFGFTVSAFNPVTVGGQQTTLRYCLGVVAEDKAMDATGAPKHNISNRYFAIDQTWLPPVNTFSVSATATYRHLGSTSEVCVSVNTTPPQANAPIQATIFGPGNIPTTLPPTLNAAGSIVLRFPISQFGTYTGNVVVTSGGTTQAAGFTVVVSSAAGSCT